MNRHVAFLSAINVGGHNVKMTDLKALFAQLGFAQVETFIASGNVIFVSDETDVAKLEASIEAHLHQSLGYAVATFLRTPQEIAAIAAHHPFGAVEGETLHVTFRKVLASEAVQAEVLALASDMDDFEFREREMYWRCKGKLSDSPLFSGSQLSRATRNAGIGTMRNLTTVRKLAAKYPP